MSTVIRISVNIQQNREEWEICLHCQFVFSSRHLLNMKYYSRPYFSSTCNEALEHHSSSATLLGSSVWLNNLISSTNCLLQHHLIIQNIVKALCWLIFDFFFFFLITYFQNFSVDMQYAILEAEQIIYYLFYLWIKILNKRRFSLITNQH